MASPIQRNTSEPAAYLFGEFRLEPAERVLRRNGEVIPLTQKTFDTLLALIERRGQLVAKDELMRTVWPDAWVEENNLNKSIYALRKALGDDASAPRFIQTAPKLGYRFIAPVRLTTQHEMQLVVEHYSRTEVTAQERVTMPAERRPKTVIDAEIVPHPSRMTAKSFRRKVSGRVAGLAMIALMCSLALGFGLLSTRRARPSEVASIAVLPFQMLGDQAGGSHLGIAMADALITRLSVLGKPTVRPTSAILKYDGAPDAFDAARTLGVDAVLEGSLQQSDSRIRVTAQLIRVKDRSVLWAGQFDEREGDFFGAQDNLSRQIVKALALNLTESETAKIANRSTSNLDAFQLYLEGRREWNRRTLEGARRAEDLFRRAIEKDPNFALSHVGLADTLLMTVQTGEAERLIERAIEIDPGLGEAYASRGLYQTFHLWRWREAEQDFQRAIRLNPGYGTAHQWYASLLAITGRLNEARAEMRRALEIDPGSPNFLADMGQMLYFAREYEEAESYCRQALQIDPDFPFAKAYLFLALTKQEKFDQSLRVLLDHTRNTLRDSRYSDAIAERKADELRRTFEQSGMKGMARVQIEKMDRGSRDHHYALARWHILAGREEGALDHLEKHFEDRALSFDLFVKVDPVFAPLHHHPRFQTLLQKLDLIN